ncbi:Nn.00g088180.m01.CDS01 [Neocucurbitaria sp. VM-36]
MPPKKPKQRALKPSTNPIPPPFGPAPPELAPLLSTFDTSSVYIIHTDPHPAWFKKRIFAVPVLLNLFILLILLWRAYYVGPYYWAILLSVLGNANETTIYYAKSTWGTLTWKVVKRMTMFLLDWVLFRIVGPWPWSFFAEQPGNPVSWRWNVGFRDEEVYVRASRGWGAKDLLGAAEGSSGKAGQESPFFKTRILPAVDAKRVREKTGYLLMDGNFDLDFYGMIAATQLLDKKDIALDQLKKIVIVFVGEEESGQWAVWDCSKLDQGSETEARNKVIEFKDRLTAMGKENLFFKWVELIQYESNAPGGFTEERQVAAAEKAKKMFEDQGVDWETFSKEIGGLDGMPGM